MQRYAQNVPFGGMWTHSIIFRRMPLFVHWFFTKELIQIREYSKVGGGNRLYAQGETKNLSWIRLITLLWLINLLVLELNDNASLRTRSHPLPPCLCNPLFTLRVATVPVCNPLGISVFLSWMIGLKGDGIRIFTIACVYVCVCVCVYVYTHINISVYVCAHACVLAKSTTFFTRQSCSVLY